MAKTSAKPAADAAPINPLSELSDLLNEEMAAVNAEIMTYMQSDVALIPQLASYLIAAGGKRIRPLLTLAVTQMYAGEMARAHRLAAAVEFIHTATLLHDDVVDESAQRRGQDSANLVFGNQASVLVGDFLFSRAFQLMVKDGSLDVLRILSSASAVIAEGEVLQLSTAGQIETSMAQYIEVITAKTAALFAAACEVGPVIADADDAAAKAMHDYGLYLGIAFQIADDALDYFADSAAIGKTAGDDFREGKMTAPVLFALEAANDEERAFWSRVITDGKQKPDDFEQALALMTKHDAHHKTIELAETYVARAKAALNEAPDHEFKALLDNLIDFTLQRST